MTLRHAFISVTTWWRNALLRYNCQFGSHFLRKVGNRQTKKNGTLNKILLPKYRNFECAIKNQLTTFPYALKANAYIEIFNSTFRKFHSFSYIILLNTHNMGSKWPVSEVVAVNLKESSNSEYYLPAQHNWPVESNDQNYHIMEDFEPMFDMDRDLYGGSNESLAENLNGQCTLISDEDSNEKENYDGEEEEDDDDIINELTTDDEVSETSNEGKAMGSTHMHSVKSLNELTIQNVHYLESFDESKVSESGSAKSSVNGNSSSEGGPLKPPNIIVYTGNIEGGEVFKHIKQRLYQCLDQCSYTIYFLSSAQLTKVPWTDNTALFVLFCDNLSDDVRTLVLDFCHNGGKCLNFFWGTHSSILSSLQKLEDNLEYRFLEASSFDASLKTFVPRIIEAEFPNDGKIIIYQQDLLDDAKEHTTSHDKKKEVLQVILSSNLGLSCAKASQHFELTPCYLLHENQIKVDSALETLEDKLQLNKLSTPHRVLHFVRTYQDITEPITTNYLPVIFDSLPSNLAFDYKLYFYNLKTKILGKPVFFTETITTTMNLLQSMSDFPGAIAITNRQTQGTGRSGNQWLSPTGCAMFTLYLSVPHQSRLGQTLPFCQHLAALALVHSIRSIPGLEDLDLRIKWPNDIYYGKEAKLGGVYVTTTFFKDKFHCYVGCGFNVSNSKPTTCLNDLILKKNLLSETQNRTLSIEETIAKTITHFENLVNDYQDKDSDICTSLYYDYWLHSNQTVILEETGEQVVIEGLDEFGFLKVITKSGKTLTLQPDGNSFDLLKNLITVKSVK